jgi:hypothetical protein
MIREVCEYGMRRRRPLATTSAGCGEEDLRRRVLWPGKAVRRAGGGGAHDVYQMEWWGQRRSRGWGWRRRGIEGGGGGTKGGGIEGGSAGAEVGSGIEGGGAEVGQPDGVKPNFTVIRVSRRRGYSPYTRYIFCIGWIMSADANNEIYGIGWVTSADINKAQPINIAHTPLFWPSTTVAAATVLTESNCSDWDYLFLRYFFNFL